MGLKCPICGYPVQEGDNFCPVGHSLTGDLPAAGIPDALPSGPAVPPSDANGRAETLRLDGILAGEAPAAVRPASAASAKVAAVSDNAELPPEPIVEAPDAPVADECADFKVEYDAGRIFVEGISFPFNFRLLPLRDDFDDLFIEIRRQTGERVGRDDPEEYVGKGRRLDISIPYRPTTGINGKIVFNLYVGYSAGGEKRVYMARQAHRVFPAKEKAQSIINALTLEYHTTINQANAADIQVGQRLKDLETLHPHGCDSAEEIIKRLDFDPMWKPLALRRCKYNHHGVAAREAAPPPMPAAAKAAALRLETRTRTVVVLSDSRAVVGRARNCDVCARIHGPGGEEDRGANQCLSRFHCQIEAGGRDCVVVDKVWYPDLNKAKESGRGTFIDGVRIHPSGGSAKLPVDRPFVLALGGPSEKEYGAYAFSGRLHTAARVRGECGGCACAEDPQAVSGLVLQARENERDAWACIWQALPLAALDPAWGPGCLCRNGEGFLVRVENRCEWLVPGRPLNLPGLTLRVEKFEKEAK